MKVLVCPSFRTEWYNLFSSRLFVPLNIYRLDLFLIVIIRTKLRLLNFITPSGKTKTLIRGLLIRMNRLSSIELTLRVLDILKTLIKELKIVKSVRKIYLQRFVKPKEIVNWFEAESYPLKIEYC